MRCFMFLNFKIKNFLSIKDEYKVAFSINESQQIDNTSEKLLNRYINKIGCIVGPNAAGKTNVLRAFVSFARFIEHSYIAKQNIIIEPHFFNHDGNISFSTEFIENNNQYAYEIILNKKEIIKERLRKLNLKTNRYNDIYYRDAKRTKPSNNLHVNKADLLRLDNNVSFFSFLKHLNYFKLGNISIDSFAKVLSNVQLFHFYGIRKPMLIAMTEISNQLAENEMLRNIVVEEIQKVDLGIDDVVFVEAKQRIHDEEKDEQSQEKDTKILATIHKANGKQSLLPIFDASEGTSNYISLFVKVHDILQNGGILVADELENSLHIDLVERILNLFMKKETNPHNAQILFSTHNPWFLQYLTKTQIFIVEKEKQQTEIFRLDEIKDIRNDENYFLKYIAGEYDGKPKIKE